MRSILHPMWEVLLLLSSGVRLSAKKSDKEHQYGHERMECVSSIVLAGMLLVTGLGIGITGVRDIVKSTSGGTIAIPGTLALIAAVVSIVTKEWMFWYTRGAAKKINSGALMADAGITALMHFPLSEPLWVSSEQDWDTPSWILLPVS